jgi:membrane protease YdiL (CAAX protease family)
MSNEDPRSELPPVPSDFLPQPDGPPPNLETALQPSAEESKPRVWTVLVTLLVVTVVYLGVSTVFLILTMVLFAGKSGPSAKDQTIDQLLDAVFTQPASIFLLLVPGQLAILAITICATVLSPSPFVARLSLNRPTWPWWTTVAAVLAAPFFSFLWSLVLSGFFESSEYLEKMATMFRSTADGFGIVPTLLCIAALPAFSEEWLFRGYVQTRLAQRWRPWVAILVSSLLFAAFHMEPIHVIAVFPIGLWFGYISWRCASILPAMLAHAYNNALSLIGVIYDQSEALDATMSSISNQLTVFLGLPALVVFLGYLAVSRTPSSEIVSVEGEP